MPFCFNFETFVSKDPCRGLLTSPIGSGAAGLSLLYFVLLCVASERALLLALVSIERALLAGFGLIATGKASAAVLLAALHSLSRTARNLHPAPPRQSPSARPSLTPARIPYKNIDSVVLQDSLCSVAGAPGLAYMLPLFCHINNQLGYASRQWVLRKPALVPSDAVTHEYSKGGSSHTPSLTVSP